jgi:hypothetical protein
MITVIAKGHGRIDQRINGIYRSNLKELPSKGERVRIVIDMLEIEIEAIVCEVYESIRKFDLSLLENPYKTNRLLAKIRKEENLSVVSEETMEPLAHSLRDIAGYGRKEHSS